MRARARPLILRTVFQILFRISQSKGKNENPKTDISPLKSVFFIRILKSKSRFPNRTHPKTQGCALDLRHLTAQDLASGVGLYTFCSKKRLFCSKELPPKKAILLEIMLQKYYYARIMLLYKSIFLGSKCSNMMNKTLYRPSRVRLTQHMRQHMDNHEPYQKCLCPSTVTGHSC